MRKLYVTVLSLAVSPEVRGNKSGCCDRFSLRIPRDQPPDVEGSAIPEWFDSVRSDDGRAAVPGCVSLQLSSARSPSAWSCRDPLHDGDYLSVA